MFKKKIDEIVIFNARVALKEITFSYTYFLRFLRGSKKSTIRRMRRGKKKKQREDSNVEMRYKRNVSNQKTRIHGK